MFSNVVKEPEDPIYGLQVVFKKDERPSKINLSIGVLPAKEGDGKAFRFSSVDKAEASLLKKQVPKDYLPIDGLASFSALATALVLGEERKENALQSYTAQTVGGTAALHIAAKFILQNITKKIFIPNPTWVNHQKLFEACGLEVQSFAYKTENGKIDLPCILSAIQTMPEGSCIVLQASCQNPTGIDPTEDEWRTLSQAIKERKLIPLFDLAYQGLGRGLDEDAASIRLFFEEGHEMLIATSFSKNFGLYNDRLGALTITYKGTSSAPISSQIRKIIRSIYSSPPAHGAYIVQEILSNPELSSEWRQELKTIRAKLDLVKQTFYKEMQKRGLDNQIASLPHSCGLFTLCSLTLDKIRTLRTEKALYLADDGRINIAALRPEQIESIANSIAGL